MDCELYQVGRPDKDGRTKYKCKWCTRKPYSSTMTPERIHLMCAARPEVEGQPRSFVEDLPEESRQLLIGDRIKQLTDALGIPQCGGCAARQEWLNKAHRWALGMWG